MKKIISLVMVIALVVSIIPIGIASEFAEGSGTENELHIIETKEHLNGDANDLAVHYEMVADITYDEDDMFAGGKGTIEEPYLIETPQHLDNVRKCLDANYKLIADIIFTESDFAVDGDFHNARAGWKPIGEYGVGVFSGVFDGNGHKITGLYINVESSDANAVGLFGLCDGAEIRNLTLGEGDIQASAEKSTIYAGGFVGFLQESTVINCSNYCTVNAGDYMSRAGGIVGYATSESSVKTCTNYGAVTASNVAGDSYAGGIAGEICWDSVVEACENNGDISSDNASGGIAGDIFQRGQITNSRNSGTVLGSKYSGGIVGFSRSSISGCSNRGIIETVSGGSCGGIVGYMNGGKVTTSYNTAEINTSMMASNIGGIAGSSWHGSKIQQCYNSGKINGKNSNTGGIVGWLVYESSVEFTYNVGKISSTGTKGAIAGYVMTGANAGIITNTLYLDNINNSAGTGTDDALKCTNAQMQQETTYAEWDFDNTWEIKENNFYRYPTLQNNPYFDNGFSGGSGTASDPYLIETKEHLNNVRNNLSANYKLIADIEFTSADFFEDGKFYNDGQGWLPIGSDSKHAFTGTFDGDGHSVKKIYTDISSSDDNVYVGLWGYNKGTIENLGLVDSNILASSSGETYAGSIVGYNASGTIRNCYSTGSISSSTTSGYKLASVGGIAGYNSGNIINCYNTGSVLNPVSGTSQTGGVVGENSGTIEKCFNIGTVTSTSILNVGVIGGVVGFGWEKGVVTECYNTGTLSVSSSASNETYIGGIVGREKGSITNCYNSGMISGSATNITHAGGVAGTVEGTVSNCYNTGEMSLISDSSLWIGGVIGTAYGKIINCYNTGNITGTVKKDAYAGGVIGENYNCIIENCYNTGSVSASTMSAYYSAYAGGVVGRNNSGTVLMCYYIDIIPKGIGNGEDTTTPLAPEKMKQQSSFEGFDFENVWTMAGGECYLYPELKNIENTSKHKYNEYDICTECGNVGYIVGDVNDDKSVNTIDRMILARYLAKWGGYSAETFNLFAADVNKDGIVNTIDRMILARYLAKWDGYNTLPVDM